MENLERDLDELRSEYDDLLRDKDDLEEEVAEQRRIISVIQSENVLAFALLAKSGVIKDKPVITENDLMWALLEYSDKSNFYVDTLEDENG